jgi:DNA-binding MarR family transcriptional regulator
MSIRTMQSVWQLRGLSPTQKLVLLKLADHAHASDGKCWPSIANICRDCGLSDRGVQKAISDLEKLGHLQREARPGKPTIYHLTPEPDSPPPPNQIHPERDSPRI